ncbi:ExeM/NucH family extracellular endonuclease [Chamaesiphon polymorphus]|uniref:ExeM/NucH family extracellular endonuclease n=1 Tax=Chamaesiphon polymorphus TaxID=2107691 RepID=UPI0011B1D4E9|nr:ExeM/NucH family extracellular endonuclease [Chamaesiphon polymorphus]
MSNIYHDLAAGAFTQNWSNAGLITANDDWSGVPSIIGYRGDGLTSLAGVDPQTILAEGTPVVDVNANQTNPNTFNTGGVTEFAITDPVVALTGSNTAQAPYLLIHLNTLGVNNVNVSFNLRDIDGSADNAIQPIAVQYRVGTSGNFTNLPAGYIADASSGPSLATQVTPVSLTLPAAAENQAQVQLRIITTNAAGNDEWIGIDDINIASGGPVVVLPVVSIAATSNAAEAGTANGSFRISRTGDTTNALNVNYSVSTGAGQATPSDDYTTLPGTATIAAGSSFVDVLVAPVDDAIVEGDEAVTLTLSPSAGFTLGTATANVTIVDNDTVAPSTTKISTIQGSGTAATAGTFTIEGIVVGDFQGTGQLGGFYLQEENTDADGNVETSEGIFVNSLTAVNVGDKVRVTGTVAENAATPSFNQAIITPSTAADVSVQATGQQALVTPTALDLPIATVGDLERYEGMLITIPEALTVTEVFNLGRFGEVSLSADGRLFNPTNIIDPNDAPASGTSSTGNSNVAAVTAQQDLNNRRRIILDDGSSSSNLLDVPYIDTTDANPNNDTLRIGSTIGGLTGVLGFGFSNYRIQPTQAPVFNYEARPALPDVGGGIKVGSFNVLNYFNGDGGSGGFPTSRGADTTVEFDRQRAKIISAIKDLNADVVGLIEMENDGDGANSAIVNLVNGLNASIGSNTYDYIKLANTTGSPGTDEIKVAFIYKPGAVTPVGNAVYFNDSAFNTARPPLAQTFINNASGEKFTPIVNHFKSKGSSAGLPGDSDQGDGQGLSNATRKAQSTALLNFVTQMQTASGDSDVMVLGDLNAYNEEDPIDILRAGGLTKLNTTSDSFVFDGQTGSLDHALVTSSLQAQVTGAAKWSINSSEPIVLDYNDDVISSGENTAEDRNDTSLYQPNRFRSSDHDPVLAGLNLKPTGGNAGADNQVGTNGSDTLFGNTGNDIINAGGGNDFIVGGIGVDLLFGGAGNDNFVYYGANEGFDKINDFVAGQDRFSISRSGFGINDAVGVLDASRFTIGSSASTANHRFIYNNNSGVLSFDADGSGTSNTQVRIAQLVGIPALTNNSFSLF